MEGDTSWISHCFGKSITNFNSSLHLPNDKSSKEVSEPPLDFSFSDSLPDELLEKIIYFLPIASIVRSSSVSKRWREVVASPRFLYSLIPQTKPWYFMFTSCDDPTGYAYDPVLRKWYDLNLRCITKSSNSFISSSSGLVTFVDSNNNNLFVCNPITGASKKVADPPSEFADYTAVAMSADPVKRSYKIAVVRSKQVPESSYRFWIHLYDSDTETWARFLARVIPGWRGGNESVICGGVLYVMVYSTRIGACRDRHKVLAYDLGTGESRVSIREPCALTCGRLMNLDGKLGMVGGLGRADRMDIIKGIGIWVLKGEEWEEIGRVSQSFFQKFGEIDDVFASGGMRDLIYIHSYGGPLLLIFDMKLKQWKWSHKCPVVKKFSLQLFTGFCFEPSLGIAP